MLPHRKFASKQHSRNGSRCLDYGPRRERRDTFHHAPDRRKRVVVEGVEDALEEEEVEELPDGSPRRSTHSMVLMVMTTGSEVSLVQGTWMRSSWMCPLTSRKGSRSSRSSASSRRSRLLNTASPPTATAGQWWKECGTTREPVTQLWVQHL
ncbi:hypothetical protein HPB48_022716 [Haemaphysalis longicornis]|uniref:Uncharacterized protein n=1 Tax=Haemaphysalis longicornis TaxID=44386 RepID=A0A9J6GJE6_HAELO|nr:hypothetical protein HPB48_022716 [Haemaphysalis longicornis]